MLRKKSLRRGKQAKAMEFISSLDSSVSLSFVLFLISSAIGILGTNAFAFLRETNSLKRPQYVFRNCRRHHKAPHSVVADPLSGTLILKVVDLKGTVLSTLNGY
jgi:hypothetical protein